MHPSLRDYQVQFLDDIRAEFRAGSRATLGVLPTGAGKTVCFTELARSAASKGKRVCVMVHRRELLNQTVAKLDHPHGVIAPGHTPRRELIQVASVQALVNRLHHWEFDLIVIDEAHHVMARTYMEILNANPKARALGVTATPVRMDGRGLGDKFDRLVVGPSVAELIEQGYLCPAEVYAPSTINVESVHVSRGDFVRSELADAADQPKLVGDAVEHYKRYADGMPAIAFCVSLAHAEHVAEEFKRRGFSAKMVDGKMHPRERDGAIAGLARGTIDVLTTCDLISEGLDVPVVSCGILLRPTKSLGLFMQQVGRTLRPLPGKDKAIILDHAGNCLRHGLPDMDREWSLETSRKKGAGKPKEFDPALAVRICEQCFAAHAPAPTCPMCGWVYPVQSRSVDHVEGELVKLDEVRAKIEARKEVGKAREREQLEKVAAARGYSPRWVDHILKARAAKKQDRGIAQES